LGLVCPIDRFVRVCRDAGGAAQMAEETAKNIGKVDVRFLGVRNVSEQVVRANIQVREGTVFDEALVDRDVRHLYRTGLFELIEVKKEDVSFDKVNLVFEVTPKFRVLSVELDGNRAFSRHRLIKKVETKPKSSLDERQIKADTEKLFDYYQKKGYSQAEVNYSIERDRTTGFGRVIFRIREGLKTKISDVRFVGNDSVEGPPLARSSKTPRRHWMFLLAHPATDACRTHFEEDLAMLRDFDRREGYLVVEFARAKCSSNIRIPGHLVSVCPINEGRRTELGRVGFSGNKIFPARFLSLALNERPGNWFTPSKLDKDVEAVEEFYGKSGYLDTRVRLHRKPNLATGAIDVDFEITEGEKVTLESIPDRGQREDQEHRHPARTRATITGQVFDSGA
jgi:outer membrane protein insertion porin family